MAEGINTQSGFRVNAPLNVDADFIQPSIAQANIDIPIERRYEGKPIFVLLPAEKGLYNLEADLTTWKKSAADSALNYQGGFDPNVGAVPQVIDGTVDYSSGDIFVCNVQGFYNFTTGDQSPDGGGDNIINPMEVGDFVVYNPDGLWEVIESVSLIQSVNGKVGVVVLVGSDIGITPYGGLSATDIQAAFEELDDRDAEYLKKDETNTITANTGIQYGTPGVTSIYFLGVTLAGITIFTADPTFSQGVELLIDENGIEIGGSQSAFYAADIAEQIRQGIIGSLTTLIPKKYSDNFIGGQLTNALLQSPTPTEDGYVITWDDGAQEWTLAQAAASVALEERVMFDSNLDTTRVLFYNNNLTFGSFFFDNSASGLDLIGFETSTDGITWTDHGTISASGTAPAALQSWVDANGGSNWYLRLTATYGIGAIKSTGVQFTITR